MEKQEQMQCPWIASPMSGTVVPLEEVPDGVFSRKVMGEGAAILPADGLICAPVDGVLSSVADTKHAYGFVSTDGVEVLVHVGLETISLQGAPFTLLAEVGQDVRKGDPVARVDLDLLQEKGINPITPVVICGGAEKALVQVVPGKVKAGTQPAMQLLYQNDALPQTAPGQAKKEGVSPAQVPENQTQKAMQTKAHSNGTARNYGKAAVLVLIAALIMVLLFSLVHLFTS